MIKEYTITRPDWNKTAGMHKISTELHSDSDEFCVTIQEMISGTTMNMLIISASATLTEVTRKAIGKITDIWKGRSSPENLF